MEQDRSVKGFVSGRVQGVGFRYFVKSHAQAEGIHGYARNLPDGRVEFLLQGESAAVTRVINQIRVGPGYARVTDVSVEQVNIEPERSGFDIG